jgi:aerobic C4-dicarboxylate transport protein
MSEARALTNLVGNGVATLVVAKWTGDLDTDTLQRELNGLGERPIEDAEMSPPAVQARQRGT